MKNIDFTRIETWAHGLFAASIVAGATTGGALLTSYVGGTNVQWHQLFTSIGISSLIAALFYLQKSPLPEISSTTTTTVETFTHIPPDVDLKEK